MDVKRRLNGREWESMSEMYVDGVHWVKGVIEWGVLSDRMLKWNENRKCRKDVWLEWGWGIVHLLMCECIMIIETRDRVVLRVCYCLLWMMNQMIERGMMHWMEIYWSENVEFVWDVKENIDVGKMLYVSSKVKRKRMNVHGVWIKRFVYNIIWLAERVSVQLEMENLMSTKMECCCRNDDMCECSIWITWMNGNFRSVSWVLDITRWSARHGTILCSNYRSSVILSLSIFPGLFLNPWL